MGDETNVKVYMVYMWVPYRATKHKEASLKRQPASVYLDGHTRLVHLDLRFI